MDISKIDIINMNRKEQYHKIHFNVLHMQVILQYINFKYPLKKNYHAEKIMS